MLLKHNSTWTLITKVTTEPAGEQGEDDSYYPWFVRFDG